MPLTVIPLAMNFMIGVSISASNCPVGLKILFISMLVAKFAIFFIAAFFINSDFMKRIYLAICAGFNVLLIVLGIIKAIPMMAIGCSILLILLIIWSLIAVFDIHIKSSK